MLCPSPGGRAARAGPPHSGCFGCERAARKVNPSQPSQGSHPQADTDKLKITGCVKATQLNLSRCGFHCALASLSRRTPCSWRPFCLILQGFYFWEGWGGACRVPHEQNKEVAALSLCAQKNPSCSSQAPGTGRKQRNSGTVVVFGFWGFFW